MPPDTRADSSLASPTDQPTPPPIAPWKLDLLRTLAAAPSVMSGTNLNSTERYRRIVPVDVDAFLRCHVIGPAVVGTPVDADVECPDGTARRVRGYFKTPVAPPPSPPPAEVSYISLGIDNKATHFTPSEVVQASEKFRFLEASGYLERSARFGCWLFGIVPAKAMDALQPGSWPPRSGWWFKVPA